MYQNLKPHKEYLLLIQKANKNQREALLKTATLQQLKAISECTLNVCTGNVKLTPRQFSTLKKHKNKIHKFLKSKSTGHRRLALQTGGFLPILLSVILPILTSLTETAIKKLLPK